MPGDGASAPLLLSSGEGVAQLADDAAGARASRSVPFLLAALIILLGMIPFTAAIVLYSLHSRAERGEAEVQSERIARLVLRNFEQTMEPIDSLLLNFINSYDPQWTPEQTHEVLKSYSLPPSIAQMSVIDQNGFLVASSFAPPDGSRVDLSDREHVRVHFPPGREEDSLFISKPLIGRITKRWTLQLTRPLHDRDGGFAGVVSASFRIEDFINFFSKLRVDEEMLISLVGRDGIVRGRAAGETTFGENVANGALFQDALRWRSMAFEARSQVDNVNRVGYVMSSAQYPILVFVGFSDAFVGAQSEDFRAAIWGTAMGLFLALLLVVILTSRYMSLQKRLNMREVQAAARLREAKVLDAISRVPGISVMHVSRDGPSAVGASDPAFSAAVARFLRGKRFSTLTTHGREPRVSTAHLADGANTLEVEMVVAPLDRMAHEEGGQELVVFAVDQTSRRMEENQLYQMSKLASIGEVATGLAHEINQPLGVIRLAAANGLMGIRKGLPPEHVTSKLERIIQQTARMSRIIDHMRIFGRKSDERFEPCHPCDALDGALDVMGERFRLDRIDLARNCVRNLPRVVCRQDQLEQVFINLLQNARDAIFDRRQASPHDTIGHISIVCAADTSDPQHPRVRLDVSDDAGGIPPDVIDRVFQPFFTTKPPGKGTGLGLSVSFGIIRDHGGTLSVANGPRGAIFTIVLPAEVVQVDGKVEGKAEGQPLRTPPPQI